MSQFLVPIPESVRITSSEEPLGPIDLKALTHPTRWRLLWVLERLEHQLCVQELAAQIEGSALSTISYHLCCLRRAGFIESQKQGTRVYYFLRRDRLRKVSEAVAPLGKEDI